MKKIFMMLLIMFIIYIGIQLGFRFFGDGHEYEYTVVNGENSFQVKEKLVNNTKGEINGYYFEIGIDGTVFSFQTYRSFNKAGRIIKDVAYYQDNEYKCILPVFIDNKIISDVMCLKGGIIYKYYDIKEKNSNLDSFIDSLKEFNYDENNWKDNAEVSEIDELNFYKDNIIDNHFIALTTYKGIYTINDVNSYKPRRIDLFNNDVYKKNIGIIFKNYYVVADYNAQYRFDKFYVVDLSSNKVSEINCEREISFDSYIQGTYNNSIYFFDRDIKKQYEVNLKTNKVLEVGNENTGIKIYRNNDWDKVTAVNAKNNIILFDSQYDADIEANEFNKVDKVGGHISGYYYFYKKVGTEYIVYRASVLNPEQKTYLFKTTDINRVIYYEDYIYYINGNEIKYFSEQSGIKTLIKYKELSFNENLIFGLYVK